jgi:hypothetical protein
MVIAVSSEMIAFYSARLDDDEAEANRNIEAGLVGNGTAGLHRVLREVAAGRGLIAAYEAADVVLAQTVRELTPDTGMPPVINAPEGPAVSMAFTKAALAAADTPAGAAHAALKAEVARRTAVYADHPGYDNE